MDRFIKTERYECIDTSIIIPHHECYLEEYGCLISEQINGSKINLGEIKCSCNNYEHCSKGDINER